jgi:hypothetical protein
MAFSHGSKAKVLLNGYDVSNFVKSASFSGSLDTAETSVMGNTSKQFVTGLLDGSMSLDGYFDGATGAIDEIMNSATSVTTDGIMYFPQGYATLGLPVFGFDANTSSYEVSTDVGDAATWSAQFSSNVGTERGLLHHIFQAEVAGGNTTGIDYGAVSTLNGGAIYMQASAAATLALKLQDSADNSAWADVSGAAFTTVSARSYQRVAFTGTVRRYTRFLWTGTGTFAASFVRK